MGDSFGTWVVENSDEIFLIIVILYHWALKYIYKVGLIVVTNTDLQYIIAILLILYFILSFFLYKGRKAEIRKLVELLGRG